MKTEDLKNALEHTADDLIEEALPETYGKTKVLRPRWLKPAVTAACVCLVALLGVIFWPGSKQPAQPPAGETTVTQSGIKKVQAADLLEPYKAQPVAEKKADAAFREAGLDWAARLLTSSYQLEEDNKNLLLSPLSVMTALAMTSNGAKSNTLAQLEAALGGELKLADLNAYLHTYLNNLPSSASSRFHFANGIWFKDQADFQVEEDFLQTNVNYYDAAIRKAPFDDSTLQEINQWTAQHTDNMIPQLLQMLPEDVLMVLVNALCFEAKWRITFEEENCRRGEFTNRQGEVDEPVYMFGSVERYLEKDGIIGITKYYEGMDYQFVAFLPEAEEDFDSFVASLNGEKLASLLDSATDNYATFVQLPKFSNDFSASLVKTLEQLGIKDAFGKGEQKADFSGISQTPLFISDVIHKTHIDVDSEGTRAAAATAVMLAFGGYPTEVKEVSLTRPFVYMIVDSANQMPLFVGTVTEFSGE